VNQTAYSGVLKIVRFNWPWYIGSLTFTALAIFLLKLETLSQFWVLLLVAAFVVANLWLFISLAVSHYIYDRSPVSRAGWLIQIDPNTVRRAAVFHAGQDEASEFVARALPCIEIQTFDFFDPARNGTASLKRARGLAKRRDLAIPSDEIPLEDDTLDLALVVFAAHEIREDMERTAFLRELGRALAPNGRVVIVEHLRDVWNFLAYGPGAFHFLSGKTWCQSFANGGLKLLRETSCTRFVRVFELKKL
jgi:SAM-dependent methyltransferase